MRFVLAVIFAVALCAGNVFAQRTPNTADPQFRQDVLTALAEHPDQEAVALLKSDIESGRLKVVPGRELKLESAEERKNAMLSTLVAYWFTHALIVPQSFFALDACHRRMAVEAAGLVYGRLPEFDEEMGQLVALLSGGGGESPEDREALKQLMSSSLDKFEKFFAKDIDRFAPVAFSSCSAAEIQPIFGNDIPTTDAKTWADALKKKVSGEIAKVRTELDKEPEKESR